MCVFTAVRMCVSVCMCARVSACVSECVRARACVSECSCACVTNLCKFFQGTRDDENAETHPKQHLESTDQLRNQSCW